ncbi:MAG TPA: Gmad2 immunoglobulin-like domain-containing protein [Actinotalea sp.]
MQGLGTAFEGTLDYRVLVAGTETVITEGFTDSGANGEVGPFSFEVGLQPGTYSVQVWEPDMSDGASGSDPRHNLVQVDFTVS